MDQAHAIPSFLLGPVERLVGCLQKFLWVRSVVGEQRDPDGQGHWFEGRMAQADLGTLGCNTDLFRPFPCGLSSSARKEDGEFLSTEPADDVPCPDLTPENLPHLSQHRIPSLVAGAVVVLLEMIKVDHQDAQALALSLGLLDFPCQGLLQVPPVKQAREGIPDRLLLQSFLQLELCEGKSKVFGHFDPQVLTSVPAPSLLG